MGILLLWTNTVVSHVGGRPFRAKILKSLFLVSLASLGVERCRNKVLRHLRLRKLRKCFINWGHMSILQCNFEYGAKFDGHRSTSPQCHFQSFPRQTETYLDLSS